MNYRTTIKNFLVIFAFYNFLSVFKCDEYSTEDMEDIFIDGKNYVREKKTQIVKLSNEKIGVAKRFFIKEDGFFKFFRFFYEYSRIVAYEIKLNNMETDYNLVIDAQLLLTPNSVFNRKNISFELKLRNNLNWVDPNYWQIEGSSSFCENGINADDQEYALNSQEYFYTSLFYTPHLSGIFTVQFLNKCLTVAIKTNLYYFNEEIICLSV